VESRLVGSAGARAYVEPVRSAARAGPLLSERRLLLRFVDYAALAAALYVALEFAYRGPTDVDARLPTDAILWFGLLWVIWSVSSSVFDCYKARIAAHARRATLSAFSALITTFVVYLAIPYWSAPLLQSRLSVLVFAAVALVLVGLSRIAYAKLLTGDQFRRRVLIVGHNLSARSAAMLLRAEAGKEYDVVGLVAPANVVPESSPYLPILGTYADLAEIVARRGVAEVILAEDEAPTADLMTEVLELYQSGTEVRHMSDMYEEITGRIPVRHVGAHWVAALPRRAGGGRTYDLAKRLLDVTVAAVALIVTGPLMLLIALAIRLESAGPVIYRQQRQGYLGKTFDVQKFRTMIATAENGAAVWATPRDPRRTRLGRFLRPTRLDELPQLWNVLVGDMSLIGPRPERPAFVAELQKAIPFYRARMLVRPGITGWAQVNFTYASSIEDAVEKLQYDLYYVKHRSAFLDLVIALKTIGVLVRAGGQ
jgi:exopolysaccharide biosynthesis polyprenyl glycosylphosphotransferase